MLVAVAATDSDGDSGILSDSVELPSSIVQPSQLLPNYISRNVAVVTNVANQQFVLKWSPPVETTKIKVTSYVPV